MKFLLAIFTVATCAAGCVVVTYGPLPESGPIGEYPASAVPFDIAALKVGWRQRIQIIKASGRLPIIDIESTFNTGLVDARYYAKAMDRYAIALTAFSPQIGQKKYEQGVLWHDGARHAVAADPLRYVPTSTAGVYPAFSKEPLAFVEQTTAKVQKDSYPLMGEFEFRHYMSPRQYRRGERYRDVTVPIDSAAGHKLFAFSERTGIPFEIHYEVEDDLLAPLEAMLARYPKAKVIWCHVGQVRYSARTKKYGPEYVRELLATYPNLYFDLAFGGADSVYPGSGEHHATVWQSAMVVRPEWVQLIVDHPYRFLAALDIGGDSVHEITQHAQVLRRFINNLPPEVQEIVAYKAAWRLLFNEEI